jgi:hypothetical protein
MAILGNHSHIIEVRNMPFDKKYLCYMNFNISTYRQERQGVYDIFKNKDWVFKQSQLITNEGHIDYLKSMRNSKFTLCPRGNGIDTHRLFEALYVGSIPIVKKHVIHKGLEDLPILFIDSWDEVTQEFLETKYEEMIEREWNFEKLKFSWWRNLIIAS